MKFAPDAQPYLTGEAFSNGLTVPIARPERSVPDRFTLLEDLVRGRRVLHMGCVDHLPLIEEKRVRGRWMHARLVGSAAEVAGLDIETAGIAYLRDKMGYQDVYVTDVTQDAPPAAIAKRSWDVAIFGEIIEHVDDPVLFLSAFRERYAGIVKEAVLTTPNAFRADNYTAARHHREIINSDHRFWWTPYTLGKVCTRAGLKVTDFRFCQGYPVPSWNVPRRLLLSRYPALRDTLVMTVALGA